MSEKNFNWGNKYSTEEQVIGEWIDGRPLYQKTFNVGMLPNVSNKTYDTFLTNVVIRNYWGISKSSASTIILPFVHPTVSRAVLLSIDYDSTVKIYISSESDRSQFTESYVTLQYTKTTD